MNGDPVRIESLYEKREKIHAREVAGVFDRLRNISTVLLLGMYYVLPWVPWDGRQAILFDLPGRKFYIFGLTLWPQDFFYLSWLLIMAALLLFLATSVAGRVWCGYACPQTIWTQAFVWMERITEGNYAKRLKLDKAPRSIEKLLRRAGKRILWLVFAFWTGLTFVGFFSPITELASRMVSLDWGNWETFWVCFYGVATYANAGHLREQVCKYMCPYARFQSAMFDRDTLIVSYDVARGEPRGNRKRGTEPGSQGLGDCIDCNICVQVCPTGIDIRKGLQYECITCASCVDACNTVMDRMNYPRGLISYTTENALEGKPARILRPRTLIYSALLGCLFLGFIWSLANSLPLHLDVIRDRNALYRELSSGEIENVYTLRLLNKSRSSQSFRIEISGVGGAVLETDPALPELGPGAVGSIMARVRVNPDNLEPGVRDVIFTARQTGGEQSEASHEARFFVPPRRVELQ